MIRYLLLFLVSLAAQADYKCGPYDSNARNREVFTFPQSLPSLLSAWQIAGGGMTWFCDQKYYWAGQYFVGRLGNADINEIKSFSAKTSAQQLQVLNANTKAWNPTATDEAYGFLAGIAQEQLNRTRPPKIVWVTAKNGTNASRPTFAVVNGVRSTTAAAERIAVGAVCDPRAQVFEEPISGSVAVNVYAKVLPNRVALCERQ